MMTRLRAALAAIFLASAAPVAAIAEEGAIPPCPDDAIQQLHNTHMHLSAGQQIDPMQLLKVADGASAMCPDQSDVRAYASLFYGMLAKAANEPDGKLMLYGRALEGAWAADAYSDSQPASKALMPDGSEAHVNPYGAAYNQLKKDVFPELTKLAAAGHVHPIFTTQTLDACPYISAYQSSLTFETDAYAWTSSNDAVDLVMTRLEALRAVCDHRQPELVWALGKVSSRAARHYEALGDTDKARAYARYAVDRANEFQDLPNLVTRHSGMRSAMGLTRAEMRTRFDLE